MAEDLSTAAVDVFQSSWTTYRTLLDRNYMYHREVYSRLREVLVDVGRPFQFLDVACGDARASASALAGTAIARYDGIDLSEPALALAQEELRRLSCPVRLHRQDYVAALQDQNEPLDVVWIVQSLHHLPATGKLEIMRRIRHLMQASGLFIIWKALSLEGESRASWFERLERIRPSFAAITDSQWLPFAEHTRQFDIPETDAMWHRLGREAGFSATRKLFEAPHRLSAMYCFAP